VPTDWEESVALAGEVGDFVAIARRERGAGDWYLGALTDENPRTLDLPLAFLDQKARYEATIWRDGPESDWKSRPYDLELETRTVTATDTLRLALAASGGAALRLRKLP
jgi:alpha-glucosidase